MPRPRFNKLASKKRNAILEAAAKEFADKGYEAASMNQILSSAGVSKGAAYYYFDDKADLFLTVVQYYIAYLFGDIDFALNKLTKDTFWAETERVYLSQFKYFVTQPWVVGVAKVIATFPLQELESGPFADYLLQIMDLLNSFIKCGQTLGVIRTDLPDDLLMHIISALDNASDKWLFDHLHELDDEMIAAHIGKMMEILERAIGIL